jgi:deoxyribodipyrimidine photo-lyase
VSNAIVWLRRDLRLSDQPTLTTAVTAARERGGGVIVVFVVDPHLWARAGANRRWFLRGCLADVDEQLSEMGGGLVIRHGDPAAVIPALAAGHDASVVLHAQDVGPYGRARDEAVAAALAAAGCELVEADSPWVVPAGTLRTGGGGAYRVFSAYHRAWRQHRLPRSVRRPSEIPFVTDVPTDDLPDPVEISAALPQPGERAGQRALERFVRGGLDDYADGRDRLGADATSRLSPYLRFGCLHPRQLLRRLDGRRDDHARFATELAWRDFYADVLHEWPESAWSAWNPTLASIELDEGDAADARFAAWCAGRTGYPLVDAGMRQLVAEGWMHNRARMVTASFLVKDLHIDWTRGARYFLDHLVDGDLPSNNHGWQWVAGTGTDAAPYHRIFSPVRQGQRFDPDGTYVRTWLPELDGSDPTHVHEPWRAPGGPPTGYPPPIVDHAAERREALARYDRARADGDTPER